MSSLAVHTLQSAVTSAALYPFIGDHVVPFGLAVVLIDMDHVTEYVKQTGSLDIRGVFPCCKLIEQNLDKGFLVYNTCHTIEFFVFVALGALVFPLLWYVVAGMAYHMLVDIIHLVRMKLPFARAFSMIEYAVRKRSGKYITSVQELMLQDGLNTKGISSIDEWMAKWAVQKSAAYD